MRVAGARCAPSLEGRSDGFDLTAIDGEFGAGDVCGSRRNEESGQVGDFVGFGDPAGGNAHALRYDFVDGHLGGGAGGGRRGVSETARGCPEGGTDRAGGNRVDTYAAGRAEPQAA